MTIVSFGNLSNDSLNLPSISALTPLPVPGNDMEAKDNGSLVVKSLTIPSIKYLPVGKLEIAFTESFKLICICKFESILLCINVSNTTKVESLINKLLSGSTCALSLANVAIKVINNKIFAMYG